MLTTSQLIYHLLEFIFIAVSQNMKSNSRKVLKQQRDEEIAYATDTNYYSGVTSINLHRMFGQVSETGKRNYKSASLLLTIISEKDVPFQTVRIHI